MDFLHLIPDYVIHGAVALGFIGFLISSFIPWFGLIGQWVFITILGAGIYCEGILYNNMVWENRTSELRIELAEAKAESANANAKLNEALSKGTMNIQASMKANLNRLNALADKLDNQCLISQDVVDTLNASAKKPK